jgi:predicted ATPase
LARDALPDGVGLVDLGEHRLRDLSRAERVFQVIAPMLPASFPVLRSPDGSATTLCAPLTRFVGRERELRAIAGAFDDSRLVTLTGVGGVGKTRLALQAAPELLQKSPDGVFVVELGGLNDATAVDASIAASLVVQQQPGQTITDTVLSFLGNKRLLLVLDNCEHLVEAVAHLVARILSVAPGVRVLATSREALRVDGEQVMTVPSLAVPAEGAAPDLLASTEAVQLFVDRARATRSEFVLSVENANAVMQLCRRLDGIPLAIELAAARVRSMTPGEIALRLDQRFRLLTGGNRTAASRHQTLRGAIDWSYDALEPAERTLLARLAVCAGGWDLSAAEAIGTRGAIDAFDVDDTVGRLVDKSLVQAIDTGDATRYKMLETIREYALERLDASGETADVRTRHTAYYTSFAQRAGAGLKGPDERAWLGRLEDELDNLGAAVTWSLASGNTHYASACVAALSLLGVRIEPAVSSWASNILACEDARNDREYPVVLAFAGWVRLGEGRAEDATGLYELALARIKDPDAPASVVCRVLAVSGMEPSLGQNPAVHAQQMLRAAKAADDDYEAAVALNLLAVGRYMAGESAALTTAEESLRTARRCGSPTAIAYCCFTTAMICAAADPARAISLLDDAEHAGDIAANTFAVITASTVRSGLLSLAGEHRAAAAALLDSARQAFRYGRREQQATSLFGVAAALAVLGYPEPAAVTLGWAQSVLVSHDPLGDFNLTEDLTAALADLPDTLGDDRYASLRAQGAAMTAEQILEYAHEPAEHDPSTAP